MRTLSVLVATIVAASAVTAQPGYTPLTTDQVLVTIPAHEFARSQHIAPERLRAYHRFADAVVIGTSHDTYFRLSASGVDVRILDRSPWSMHYAVVAHHPGRGAQLVPEGVQILAQADDQYFVKGDREKLDVLRVLGFTCVEVERREIPTDFGTTVFPGSPVAGRTDLVEGIIANVSDSSITGYVQGLQDFVTRYYNRPNKDSVFSWVRHRFLEAGVSDVQLDSFQYNGVWQANVVATLPGTLYPDREIIIGGHLDSYSSNLNQAPGADDNATGTAAALEMARVLKLVNYQPAFTLRFIGFAAEELGLRGSASYALRARQANRDIAVMMNYDMIGNRTQTQPDRDVYIVWYVGSEAFSTLHGAVCRAYTTLTPVLTTSYRTGSDSYSFYQQNYKTVFLIERDFSPYYHSPNDLIQYLDIPYANEIIKSGLAMLLTLDQAPPSLTGVSVRDRGTGTSLQVSWDSVTVHDWYRYKVYVGTSPGVYENVFEQTARSRILTGLTEGTTYYVGVSVLDLAGREGVIVEQMGVPRAIPLAPAGLESSDLPGGVQLVWRRNLELDLRGYNIHRATNAGGPFERLNTSSFPDTLYMDSVATGTYYYYVTAVDSSANESAPSDTVIGSPVVGVEDWVYGPAGFKLFQNHPNPFNPSTDIRYSLDASGFISLRVYDLLGREVATLVNEVRPAGVHSVIWDARAVPSGTYFYRITAGGVTQTRRMVLLR